MTPAPIPPELAKALEHARDESRPTLERMAAASAARHMLDGWLQQIAWQARGEGHSWAQVGGKLGTSKQAAQQRFNRAKVFALELDELEGLEGSHAMKEIRKIRKKKQGSDDVELAEPGQRIKRIVDVRVRDAEGNETVEELEDED